MSTTIDDLLLKRLDHLMEATEQLDPITKSTEFQSAIVHARTLCTEARDGLATAARTRAIDLIENATAAADFTDKAATAIDEYGYVRDAVRSTTLNVPPSVRIQLGPAEMTRRTRFVDEFLPLGVSDMARLGRQALVTTLDTVLKNLVSEWAIAAETLQGFDAANEQLQESWSTVLREKIDDAELEHQLLVARAHATSLTIAMRGLLSAILRFENSPLDVDALLLKTPERNRAAMPTVQQTADQPPQTPVVVGE